MYFGNYLKSCRDQYTLTQTQLVQELYHFHKQFKGLDVRTLSRWENLVVQPSINRQMLIIHLFQTKSLSIFPYLDTFDEKQLEQMICPLRMYDIIREHKHLILNFPQEIFNIEDIQIRQLRDCHNISQKLSIPASVIDSVLRENDIHLSQETLQSWSYHPSNNFWIASYKDNYVGAFFSLDLKPSSFHSLISFKMKYEEIQESDFAQSNEDVSNFIILLHANNKKIASILLLRYYTYLISKQNIIKEIGAYTYKEEGRQLSKRLNLRPFKKKKNTFFNKSISYQADLETVLINENVIKMLFSKQTNCPENN